MSEPILLHAQPLTAAVFAPFGDVIAAPHQEGARNVYKLLIGGGEGLTPRLHVNRVTAAQLPVLFSVMERHPQTAQFFLPLDVASYLVVVAHAEQSGGPLLSEAKAFLAPGNVGIAYAPGVWHTSITALERAGSFSVLMGRNDTSADEEFFQLSRSLRVQR